MHVKFRTFAVVADIRLERGHDEARLRRFRLLEDQLSENFLRGTCGQFRSRKLRYVIRDEQMDESLK